MTAKRKFASSQTAAKGPNGQKLRVARAFQNLFSGRGDQEDADIVLAHLAHVTGYFRRPGYADWIASTKTPQGFELHSALCNARAEVVQTILDQLNVSDALLIELEKAARREAGKWIPTAG